MMKHNMNKDHHSLCENKFPPKFDTYLSGEEFAKKTADNIYALEDVTAWKDCFLGSVAQTKENSPEPPIYLGHECTDHTEFSIQPF